MNNTFSFNRFKNLLLKDGKMYVRNFGTSLIVWCSLNAIFWIFNLLFGSETMPPIRFGMLCTWTALAMLMVPSKVYGNANLSREGVGFAMMPASSLEKFVSMFLYCAIVTPVIVFFGGYLVDTLLSLFPFGGFDKPIRLYTLNEIVSRMMTDNEGVVQMGELSISAASLFPIGVIRTSLYMGIIQWAALFMLGNMLFKKHKAGKTFACYLGISYLFSMLFGLLVVSSDRIEQWLESLEDLPAEEVVRLWHNATIWGMIISIVITAVLLYFTYRKIKTQKY
jgi:hypothetical protein